MQRFVRSVQAKTSKPMSHEQTQGPCRVPCGGLFEVRGVCVYEEGLVITHNTHHPLFFDFSSVELYSGGKSRVKRSGKGKLEAD